MKGAWDQMVELLEKQKKEIERLKAHIGELTAEYNLHVKEYEAEIEQLRKEKEWLLRKCVRTGYSLSDIRDDESYYKDKIYKEMQQALKE